MKRLTILLPFVGVAVLLAVWSLTVWARVVDPVLLPFRDLPGDRAPGRLCRAAAEVVTKYIIIDMYANAVQGMAAEEAVKWARDELVKVYA